MLSVAMGAITDKSINVNASAVEKPLWVYNSGILMLEILMNRGVYVTLSQNIEEIKNDCKSCGWDFDDLISDDRILMVDARPFKIQDELIGKDDSLYRGEQLPFEHLTKLLLSSIKRLMQKEL